MSGIKEGTLPQGLLPMAPDGVASSVSELVLHSPTLLKASPRPNGLRRERFFSLRNWGFIDSKKMKKSQIPITTTTDNVSVGKESGHVSQKTVTVEEAEESKGPSKTRATKIEEGRTA
jgi:hypothetical protein